MWGLVLDSGRVLHAGPWMAGMSGEYARTACGRIRNVDRDRIQWANEVDQLPLCRNCIRRLLTHINHCYDWIEQ